MNLFPKLSDESSISVTSRPQTVPEKDFKTLGDDGRYRYLQHKKTHQEFALLMNAAIDPAHHVPRPGEVFVNVKDNSNPTWPEDVIRLAVPIESGSWSKAEARLKAREARRKGTDRPLRVWSALGDLFREGGSEPPPVVVGALPDPHGDGPIRGSAAMIEVKPKTVDPSAAGVLRYFADKGVELSRGKRDGTRLVARSRLRLSDYDRTLLHRMAPLIVAELGGPEVKCTECSEAATAPVEANAWACQKHLQGE